MNKKIIYIFIVIVIVALSGGVGFLAGKSCCVSPDMVKQNVIMELEQKLNSKLNLKTEDSLIPFFTKEKRIDTFLMGAITTADLQANTLKIQVKNNYRGGDFFSYLNEPNFYIKTVKISDKTIVVRQEMKSVEEFEKERKASSEDDTGIPLLPYKETKVSIQDLKKGTQITVEAETEINLQDNKTIEAKKIIVEESF